MIHRFYPKRSKKVLIGNTGSGKSNLAIDFLKHGLNTSRTLIIDSNYEIGSKLNLKTAYYIHDWSFAQPCLIPNRANVEELDEYIRYARRFTNFVLFIDDLDQFADRTGYGGREIARLMSNSRHQGIGTIICNKTPNMIETKVITNCSDLYLFALDARYLALIKEWLPSLGYPEKIARLSRIPQYTFALFSPLSQDANATSPKKFQGYYKLARVHDADGSNKSV